MIFELDRHCRIIHQPNSCTSDYLAETWHGVRLFRQPFTRGSYTHFDLALSFRNLAMPTALSDPSIALYAILGVATVLLGILALRRQKRSDLINFCIPAAALIALFVIDKAVESPREQTVRKIQEMGKASRDKKYDDIFTHVSDSFRYRTLDKKALRERAKQADGMGFGGFAEYDLARSSFIPMQDGTIEQGFRVNVKLTQDVPFYVKGTFKKDPDGEWRLVTFKLFDPINMNDEKEIPGL